MLYIWVAINQWDRSEWVPGALVDLEPFSICSFWSLLLSVAGIKLVFRITPSYTLLRGLESCV